jgi:hypothetical protein
MFSIKINDNLITEYNIDNCIFSTNESRPSKSLIDCQKYKQYSKLNFNIDILNEFSYLNSQSKTLDSLLLRELISIFKLNRLNKLNKLNNEKLLESSESKESMENISLSFDTIIINETNNSNLIFCLENIPTIKNIIENLYQLIKEMNNGDNLIINYINLFTYPSVELLIIILNIFQKVKIYYCKILKQNVLYCINYKNNSSITVFIRNILNKWKSNIRQFGIFVDFIILDLIKKHNTFIFDYYLNLNENIADSTLEDKEFFFKHYYKKYSKTNSNSFDCNHIIKEYNLEKCCICIKCHELFSIY